MFSYAGLVIVLASWVAAFYFARRWHSSNTLSISQHVASDRGAYFFFLADIVILGGLFYVWLLHWFSPQLRLGKEFNLILSITVLCQTAAAIWPDTTGFRRLLHRIAAYVMAALYVPMAVLILRSPALGQYARIVCLFLLTYMCATFVAFILFKKLRSKFLIYQFFYIVAFQILILAAAYLA